MKHLFCTESKVKGRFITCVATTQFSLRGALCSESET